MLNEVLSSLFNEQTVLGDCDSTAQGPHPSFPPISPITSSSSIFSSFKTLVKVEPEEREKEASAVGRQPQAKSNSNRVDGKPSKKSHKSSRHHVPSDISHKGNPPSSSSSSNPPSGSLSHLTSTSTSHGRKPHHHTSKVLPHPKPSPASFVLASTPPGQQPPIKKEREAKIEDNLKKSTRSPSSLPATPAPSKYPKKRKQHRAEQELRSDSTVVSRTNPQPPPSLSKSFSIGSSSSFTSSSLPQSSFSSSPSVRRSSSSGAVDTRRSKLEEMNSGSSISGNAPSVSLSHDSSGREQQQMSGGGMSLASNDGRLQRKKEKKDKRQRSEHQQGSESKQKMMSALFSKPQLAPERAVTVDEVRQPPHSNSALQNPPPPPPPSLGQMRPAKLTIDTR